MKARPETDPRLVEALATLRSDPGLLDWWHARDRGASSATDRAVPDAERSCGSREARTLRRREALRLSRPSHGRRPHRYDRPRAGRRTLRRRRHRRDDGALPDGAAEPAAAGADVRALDRRS